MLFLMSYLEEFQHVKYHPSRISTSRNMKFWKWHKFALSLQFWSKILTWNFWDYHISYTVTTWQILIKFWHASCQSLKNVAPFGMEWPWRLLFWKKKYNFPAKMAKKGRTMIQGQNQFKFFSAIGNGKQIS